MYVSWPRGHSLRHGNEADVEVLTAYPPKNTVSWDTTLCRPVGHRPSGEIYSFLLQG
jgi:hypothetical protein